MKAIIVILMLVGSSLESSLSKDFVNEFIGSTELKNENTVANYKRYDFSSLWLQTDNDKVLGIIGSNHQRIKVKILTVEKSSEVSLEYLVQGKSWVKGVVCDFSGRILIKEVRELKHFHYGVDEMYKDRGIRNQGILIADYEFNENVDQKYSGKFKGKLYSKWYLNWDDQIEYDKIQLHSDRYLNNAYVGSWESYRTNKEKICNWADYRVPQANSDFDIGAAEFFPSRKYAENGWASYQKTWSDRDKEAQKTELSEWWE
ncbi:MAG: hypothetical protein AB8H47_04430 [Bacteroidia bacterium]